jgi:hypothetical protein
MFLPLLQQHYSYFKKVSPFAFLVSSVLWVVLMITSGSYCPIWYIEKQPLSKTLKAILSNDEFRIENERGGRSWDWKDFSTWIESPFFFIYILPAVLFL